ncbi:MAG: DUF5060 domain-containing protein [Pirellulales bacterium]
MTNSEIRVSRNRRANVSLSWLASRFAARGSHGRLASRISMVLALIGSATVLPAADEVGLDRTATQWSPFVEWQLPNASYDGNPFDLEATVAFVHDETGERRTTGMFYAGNDAWSFRFTGTRPGLWQFSTSSADSELNGRRGTVIVKANTVGYGFVTNAGNKWARQFGSKGTLEAFVPQYVMYDSPDVFHGKPKQIDRHIQSAIEQHGFTGFHVPVACRWFDINHDRSSDIRSDEPNPDARTFEALELLITKTQAADGVVHLWAWGDNQRNQTPDKWGINGKVDRRLQRYIAARLGPLPGWTMGYGFDLWEWVSGEDLAEWHQHMHAHFGWPHLLGARASKNKLDQLTEVLDYSSYEQHRPDYEMYVKTIERRPNKPSFSEDRFRIRKSPYPEKDYDLERTRRGLWQSAMAGGVANIWGYLFVDPVANPDAGPSFPYPDPHAIRTNAEFLRKRFLVDLLRDNTLTDGVCLRDVAKTHFLFYREDADSVRLDLAQMAGQQPAVAVDAKRPYQEIELGRVDPKQHDWKAPYPSDWAIAVGEFPRALPESRPSPESRSQSK